MKNWVIMEVMLRLKVTKNAQKTYQPKRFHMLMLAVFLHYLMRNLYAEIQCLKACRMLVSLGKNVEIASMWISKGNCIAATIIVELLKLGLVAKMVVLVVQTNKN